MKLLHDPTSYSQSEMDLNLFARWLAAFQGRWTMGDVLGLALPLLAFLGWLLSLRGIDLGKMNDLGLVSVFNPLTLLSLALISLSFCLALRQRPLRGPLLVLHVLLLIFMLYGVTAILEAQPRFSVVYRHAGFTDYILRHGAVDPRLDAYFNWPGFFILSAFITRIAGYQSILSFAAWSPVVYNLLYLGPLSMILTSATQDKRVAWLAIWFFFLTNWIAQDYYSPQGINFFMYLAIIAILLTWFRIPPEHQPRVAPLPAGGWLQRLFRLSYAWLRAPDAPGPQISRQQQIALLVCILVIFAFVDFSHPLTPFFILMSVWMLALFRRCTPFWLPIVLTLMTVAWIGFMAQTYLVGHFSDAFGSGGLGTSVTSNLTQHVTGNAQHTFIAQIRIVMAVLVWGFAVLGGLVRFRNGHRDITFVLLALTPFPLLLAQDYGGEMLLRIYLFTLPFMVFFAASLFFRAPARGRSLLMTVVSMAMCLFLLGGFLFTRYGNESMDYMTTPEVTGVRHLYDIAPAGSILIAGWAGTPWQFENYEEYTTYSLADNLPNAVLLDNSSMVLNFITTNEQYTAKNKVYMIFTRSERRTVDATTGLPVGGLDRLEKSLLSTGQFQLVYQNQDAQILLYTPTLSVAKGK